MLEAQESGAIKVPMPYDNGLNITDLKVIKNERMTAASTKRLRNKVFDPNCNPDLDFSIFFSDAIVRPRCRKNLFSSGS